LQRACDNPFIDNPQTYPQFFVDITKSTTVARPPRFANAYQDVIAASRKLAAARRFALQSAAKQPK
jgi:hypothetical protein